MEYWINVYKRCSLAVLVLLLVFELQKAVNDPININAEVSFHYGVFARGEGEVYWTFEECWRGVDCSLLSRAAK